MTNKSHRYPTNRHGLDMDTNILNIKCLSIIMVVCIKQQFSNIESLIHEKVKQTWDSVEKRYLQNGLYFADSYVKNVIEKPIWD